MFCLWVYLLYNDDCQCAIYKFWFKLFEETYAGRVLHSEGDISTGWLWRFIATSLGIESPLSVVPALQNNVTFKMQLGIGLSIRVSCLNNARLSVTGTWTETQLNTLSPKPTEQVRIWKSFDTVSYSSLLVWTMIFLRVLPYVTHYKPNLLMVESSAKMWRPSDVSHVNY